MNIINEQVKHLKFGTGTVTAQDPSTVTVKFSEKYGSKKFLYPSAFKSFLELLDPSAKERMGIELQMIQVLAETEQNNRLAQEKKLRVLLGERAALKKKAPTKRRPPKSRQKETDRC